jgi:hypothetical protein
MSQVSCCAVRSSGLSPGSRCPSRTGPAWAARSNGARDHRVVRLGADITGAAFSFDQHVARPTTRPHPTRTVTGLPRSRLVRPTTVTDPPREVGLTQPALAG